jgi:hypothetical protein
MHRIALAVALAGISLVAAGCGGGDERAGTQSIPRLTTTAGSEASGGSSAETSAVREALAGWAKADTPQKACALMSARVRRGLLDADAGACRSKKKLEKLLGVELKPTDLKVKKVHVEDDQAVAQVEETIPETKGQKQTRLYYLVKEDGSWRVDSVDERRPGAPELPVT